ncbi:hypothetical protein G6F32_013335 [Rhizopus arrhizus]|nr:hypothetical protein G6F32_013335 [Rhizopus arrhizus]
MSAHLPFRSFAVALVAAGDLVRGGLDDAVGGQQCGGFQEFAQRGGAFKHGVRGRRLRQVDPAIARLEAAGHGDVARGLGIGPLHGQHLHVVAGRPHQLGGAAAADLPGALRAALVRRVGGVRHRHPDARVRAGVFHADVGGQFKAAPVGADGSLLRAQRLRQGGCGGAQCAGESEKVSAIHDALTHGEVWLSVRPWPGGRPLGCAPTHPAGSS